MSDRTFVPLDISKAESVGRVPVKIGKCDGFFVYTGTEGQQHALSNCPILSETSSQYESISDIKERLAPASGEGQEREIDSWHTERKLLEWYNSTRIST